MSTMAIVNDDVSGTPEILHEANKIAERLRDVGVQFEQWQAQQALADDATQEQILDAYRSFIDELNDKYAFQSMDVVSLTPEHPDKAAFREKFLAEHTHGDFEVRFFVDGSGLFYLHIGDKVYMVYCERGDLISVPADTTHWFDMGENPSFKCIRFFTTENGWVGNFTGSDIAKSLPSYDEFIGTYR